MAHLPTLLERTFGRHPSSDLASIQRRMDRFFERFMSKDALDFDAESFAAPSFSPSCDISETPNHYLLTFDVPGVKKDDLKIDLQNNTLTVSGERKEETEETKKGRFRSERTYGSFFRSFSLPNDVKADAIEANYADGVLRVALPKGESAPGSQIKIGDQKSDFFGKFLGSKTEKEKAH
jgi:HSP20 family protein